MNLASWIVLAVICAAVLSVVFYEIRKKKKGKGGCSCGASCGACAMRGACHPQK